MTTVIKGGQVVSATETIEADDASRRTDIFIPIVTASRFDGNASGHSTGEHGLSVGTVLHVE